MPRTGQIKKIKGKFYKEGDVFIQECLDGYLADEVLNIIPKGVEINGCSITIGKTSHKRRADISNRLRSYGVQRLYEHQPTQFAHLILDKTTIEGIQTAIENVSAVINADPHQAYFRYIVLSYKDGAVKFSATSKEIRPDTKDQRRKLKVLGATESRGNVKPLFKKLKAKKIRCELVVEEIKTVICS